MDLVPHVRELRGARDDVHGARARPEDGGRRAGDDVDRVAGAEAKVGAERRPDVDLRVDDADARVRARRLTEQREARRRVLRGARRGRASRAEAAEHEGDDEAADVMGPQLQPHPPPEVPLPPMAPSRFERTCSSAAASWALPSGCMMRSASSSRWCGLTVHRAVEHLRRPGRAASARAEREEGPEAFRSRHREPPSILGCLGCGWRRR